MADFCADKVIRQIRVDHTRGILRIRAASDCPRAAFFFANREKRNQAEQPVRRPNQAFGARFRQAVIRKECLQLFRRQFGHFRFKLSANNGLLGVRA